MAADYGGGWEDIPTHCEHCGAPLRDRDPDYPGPAARFCLGPLQGGGPPRSRLQESAPQAATAATADLRCVWLRVCADRHRALTGHLLAALRRPAPEGGVMITAAGCGCCCSPVPAVTRQHRGKPRRPVRSTGSSPRLAGSSLATGGASRSTMIAPVVGVAFRAHPGGPARPLAADGIGRGALLATRRAQPCGRPQGRRQPVSRHRAGGPCARPRPPPDRTGSQPLDPGLDLQHSRHPRPGPAEHLASMPA
jgi:hypothetical protein